MRLTRADGDVLLEAIRVELESQRWRELRRGEYRPRLEYHIEQGLRQADEERAAVLRALRDKIKAQMEPRKAQPKGER